MVDFNIGKRIAELRKANGVSARDLSLSIGQNAGYIYNIESGKSFPSIAGLFYICDRFGITPSEFFDDKNTCPAELNKIIDDLKRLDYRQLQTIHSLIKELIQ